MLIHIFHITHHIMVLSHTPALIVFFPDWVVLQTISFFPHNPILLFGLAFYLVLSWHFNWTVSQNPKISWMCSLASITLYFRLGLFYPCASLPIHLCQISHFFLLSSSSAKHVYYFSWLEPVLSTLHNISSLDCHLAAHLFARSFMNTLNNPNHYWHSTITRCGLNSTVRASYVLILLSNSLQRAAVGVWAGLALTGKESV